MLSREMLVESISEAGVQCEVSDNYGRESVLKLMLKPPYYIYTTVSTIQPCFWNITENVVNELKKDKVDFAIAFIDSYEEKIYIYDKKQALDLISTASIAKESGNYRLTSKDVVNPISLCTFSEFIDSINI